MNSYRLCVAFAAYLKLLFRLYQYVVLHPGQYLGLFILKNTSSINLADIFQTALLAAIGASVSFIVSLIMKRIFKRWRKK